MDFESGGLSAPVALWDIANCPLVSHSADVEGHLVIIHLLNHEY